MSDPTELSYLSYKQFNALITYIDEVVDFKIAEAKGEDLDGKLEFEMLKDYDKLDIALVNPGIIDEEE